MRLKSGLEAWLLQFRQSGGGGFLGIFSQSNTADRTYTLPDKDGTVAMLSDISGASGSFVRIPVADTNYTIVASGPTIVAYTSITAARTVTLPAASLSAGQLIYIIDESGLLTSTLSITIQRAGSDTIEGQTSFVLSGQYAAICLESNGSNKWTVATYEELPVSVADANYTVAIREDCIIQYNTLTAARVITLPAATTTGQRIILMDMSGSCSATNTLTVNRAGSDTINGGTSVIVNTAYGSVTLVSNGAGKWNYFMPGTWSGAGSPITISTSSSIPFLTSTRTDLSASVTFTQTTSNNVTFSGQFTATQFNGSGAGLSMGTVTDTYTIQNLGAITGVVSFTIANGRYIKMTLNGNVTLSIPNGSSSTATEKLIFAVTQDGTGSRTIYWQAQRGFPSGMVPALTTTPGATDLLEFTWDGAYWQLTNFNANIKGIDSSNTAIRPTNYYYGGSTWQTASNPQNAYDTTLVGVDSTTYATFAYQGTIGNGGQVYYYGMPGLAAKTGTLYIRCATEAGGDGSTYNADYSLDGGTTWTNFINTLSQTTLQTFSFPLTLQIPSNIRVRFYTVNQNWHNLVWYIYDIVFI